MGIRLHLLQGVGSLAQHLHLSALRRYGLFELPVFFHNLLQHLGVESVRMLGQLGLSAVNCVVTGQLLHIFLSSRVRLLREHHSREPALTPLGRSCWATRLVGPRRICQSRRAVHIFSVRLLRSLSSQRSKKVELGGRVCSLISLGLFGKLLQKVADSKHLYV